MKVSVIIPAHNESTRIERTLQAYVSFFEQKKINHEFVVVLNGCTDNTLQVVQTVQQDCPTIRFINLPQAGKGLAVAVGFKDALTRKNDLIGFVDADMAIGPSSFYRLIVQVGTFDGAIASRHVSESHVYPPNPRIKKWGRVFFYHPMIHLLFGIKYKDFQCGAKLFKRQVVEAVADKLTMKRWVFDIELLYLCKRHGFSVKEIPTVWYDQDDSKFTIRAGIRMLGALIKLRLIYSPLGALFGKK